MFCYVLCHADWLRHAVFAPMCRFTAVSLRPEPANRDLFYCEFKQAAADGTKGADISVAYYFEHLANPHKRLDYPWLPGKAASVGAYRFETSHGVHDRHCGAQVLVRHIQCLVEACA